MATSAPEPTPDGLVLRQGTRDWRFGPGAEVMVGRDRTCDVVLDDPRLSRQHLRIVDDGGWVIEDRSANGTWVGGRRLGREPVGGPVELLLGGRDGLPLAVEPGGRAAAGGATVRIGRARDNDIVLNDVLVSRRHAVVQTTAAGRRVTDLGSRNRTLVNGSPVDGDAPLTDGDRLTIGGTEFQVDAGELRPTPVAVRQLAATGLSYHLPKAGQLVSNVTFEARVGELVAIIGPSGAGKSTLLKLLAGALKPSTGTATYDGYDVYDEFDAVRPIVGVVPQDDVVHKRLTVRRALAYAARLRLPDDSSARERRATIAGVLADLELTKHARTRIDKLSGGQRKRVSIALELLTSPSLLLLDEPTSGLDPGLERQIMDTLRALADGGRTVVVVTHSPAHLSRCDSVLLLAPGGLLVYAGRPSGVLPHFGGGDWADVYNRLLTDPPPVRPEPVAAPPAVRRRTATVLPAGWRTRLRQARTLTARHLALIAADRGYALFLLLLPALLAALASVVPGRAGLRTAGPSDPGEAGQILVLLFVGAAFAGGAIAAREVIGERAILIRERAAGLHPAAYAIAKLAVFAGLCAIQSLVLVVGMALIKPMPTAGVLGNGAAELMLAVWATGLASAQLGLLGSALTRSVDQTMPLLVVTVMAQLVLCGGLIPITGRPVVSQISVLAPARWGYAAGAGTADLRHISPGTPLDPMWAHSPPWWLLALGVLAAMTTLSCALLARRVARLERI